MSTLTDVLAKIAPTIAATLGGPLAGTAVSAIEGVFGITPPPDATIQQRQDTLESKIATATPDDLLKLKQADNVHAENMAKLGFDNVQALAAMQVQQEKITADDRASARAREIAIKDQIPAVLAVGVTLGFFGILGYMLQTAVPVSNRDVLNIMLGSLGTAWISVIAYYFGSSAGSAEKTRLLAQAEPVK